MTTQITEYSATVSGLAELRSRLGSVVYDVTTGAGMEKARKDRRECVTLRTSLEAMRVKLKAPALERTRLIDAEAKAITAEILALEAPIDSQIKAEEGRKEAEKKERERKETERLAAIQARIAGIRGYVTTAIGKTAISIAKMVEDLTATVVDEAGYQELAYLGVQARDETLAKLREMHTAAIANELEAERLRLQAQELAAQKAAQDAIDREATLRRQDEERTAKAALDAAAAAERKRLDEEARIAREARDRADEQAKAQRDERDRLALEDLALKERALREQGEAIARKQAELNRQRDPLTTLKVIHGLVEDDFLSDAEARAQIRKVCNRALEVA